MVGPPVPWWSRHWRLWCRPIHSAMFSTVTLFPLRLWCSLEVHSCIWCYFVILCNTSINLCKCMGWVVQKPSVTSLAKIPFAFFPSSHGPRGSTFTNTIVHIFLKSWLNVRKNIQLELDTSLGNRLISRRSQPLDLHLKRLKAYAHKKGSNSLKEGGNNYRGIQKREKLLYPFHLEKSNTPFSLIQQVHLWHFGLYQLHYAFSPYQSLILFFTIIFLYILSYPSCFALYL